MTWLSDEQVEALRRLGQGHELGDSGYEVIEPLAEGRRSLVYLARDPRLQRNVALQVERDAPPTRSLAEQRWRKIVQRAGLGHPGVIPLHAAGTLNDGRLYRVMPVVEGRRWSDVASGSVPLSEGLRVFERVLETLAYGHAHHRLHQDLRPENLLLGAHGEVFVTGWFREPEPDRQRPDSHERADVQALGRLLDDLRRRCRFHRWPRALDRLRDRCRTDATLHGLGQDWARFRERQRDGTGESGWLARLGLRRR